MKKTSSLPVGLGLSEPGEDCIDENRESICNLLHNHAGIFDATDDDLGFQQLLSTR